MFNLEPIWRRAGLKEHGSRRLAVYSNILPASALDRARQKLAVSQTPLRGFSPQNSVFNIGDQRKFVFEIPRVVGTLLRQKEAPT